jgi:hypothetical protein
LRRLLVALWQGEGVRRERRVLDGLLRLLRLGLRLLLWWLWLWVWVWVWLWVLLLLLPPARRLGARLSRARGCGARGDGAVVVHLVAVRRKLLLLPLHIGCGARGVGRLVLLARI